MAVTVRIVPVPEPVKVTIKPKTPPPTVTLELNIRKSLSGDLMIFDHGDIDIVLSGKDKKVTAFPKQTMTDFTYGAQNRLFSHLARKGIVIPESIQGASFYGAMEAQLQESADGKLNAAKFALVSIEKFIKEESHTTTMLKQLSLVLKMNTPTQTRLTLQNLVRFHRGTNKVLSVRAIYEILTPSLTCTQSRSLHGTCFIRSHSLRAHTNFGIQRYANNKKTSTRQRIL